MNEQLYSRVFGCMIGGAIGDAFGGVVEFRSVEDLERICGSDWVDEFLPYQPDHGPHPLGVWEKGPPRGTATDDTRNNHIFVECAIRNAGRVNSHLLAIEYLERYRDREQFYPKHPDLAEQNYRLQYERACAYLGMRETPDGVPCWVTSARGNDFPILWGLIFLAFVGLLHPADPEAAYRTAFEAAFIDLGYARDATAMMAAMIAAASGGDATAREMVEVALAIDPFGFGDRRVMGKRLREFLAIADGASDDRELVTKLAGEVAALHPYDPIDVLGVPAAALWYAEGDPIRTIVMAVNDRDVDGDGKLVRLRDVDCTGGVAGALAGALNGADAFPDDWIADTLRANRDMYGIGIEENARRLTEVVGN